MNHLEHPYIHARLLEVREQELVRRSRNRRPVGQGLAGAGLVRVRTATLLRRAADRLEPAHARVLGTEC